MEEAMAEDMEWDLAEAMLATVEVSGEAMQAMGEAMPVMGEAILVMAGAMQDMEEASDKAGVLAWEEAGEEGLEWAEDIGVFGFSEEGPTGSATGGNKSTRFLIHTF